MLTNYQQGWKDGSLDRMFTGPLADVLIGKSAEYIRGYKDGINNRFNP